MMATTREIILWEKWKELHNKELISINDLDDLMDAVSKLLMNYKQTVESRDKFKAQVKELRFKLREEKNG